MQHQNKKQDSTYIMDYLSEAFPNRLPMGEVTSYELGVLVGQQELIEKLKLKLEYTEKERMEVK